MKLMKLWGMLCRATQDGQVMMESSDKMWSTGKGNGKSLQYFCLENSMNSMKRQKHRTLKDELPRSVGAQYAAGDQWRTNSRKNEDRGWDDWMASPTQWTWVWVNSGSWWWTGRPGVVQSTGLQLDTTEWLNWIERNWKP